MATTTPVYGWPVPTSTDYVADGAVAIEALGDAVDSTLSTALGGAYPGLRLVKKQTVGSGVSVIPVTNAFSATYDNYKIMYSNGVGSTALSLQMTLTGSTASYASSVIYAAYSGGGVAAATLGTTSWSQAGDASTGGCSLNVELSDPFNTKLTGFRALTSVMNTAGSTIAQNGLHNVASSYTGFTLTTNTGTVTGGTIYVYGYGTS
jgi:hypothetical protein